MNYIFVDIDGPLLPGKMHLFKQNKYLNKVDLDNARPKFDEFAIRCFNIWAEYSNAQIIFSTNWSLSCKDPKHSLPEIMKLNDLYFEYHDDMFTPKKFTSERGSEIWWWLLDNAKDGDNFIAVDDDQTCRLLEKYMSHKHKHKEIPNFNGKWINVDYNNGITYENFLDGCKGLNILMDTVFEREFGIKPLTDEEKQKREEDMELLLQCSI